MAFKYVEVLRENLDQNNTMSEEDISKVMYAAATSPGVLLEVPVTRKPWQSEEIQDLLRKRRLCTTSTERTDISKSIQKMSRKLLRKHQNEATSKLLESFSGLSELPKN